MAESEYSEYEINSEDNDSSYVPSEKEDSEDCREIDTFGVNKEFLQEYVVMDGKIYYNNLSLFNHGSDSEGVENRNRMKQGNAPLGKDGKPLNLHHLDQTEDGPLVALEETWHQEHYSEIHWNTGGQPSEIDRSKFDKERKSYWKYISKLIEDAQSQHEP